MSDASGPATTPAGWYPDPDLPGGQRYWDGVQWTDHRAPGAAGPTASYPTTVMPSVNSAPAKGGIPRWVLVVGGVLGVILLIGLVGSALGGGKSSTGNSSGTSPAPPVTSSAAATAPPSEAAATETTSEPASAPSSEAAATETSAAVGIGTPVRDGKFEFVVKGIKCGVPRVGNDILGSKAQGQFCLVTMSVTNIGDEGQIFDANAQNAYNAAGQKYEADGEASLYANEDGESFIENINPGNAIDVVVVFDIPKNAALASLELHDSILSGGVGVDLQ